MKYFIGASLLLLMLNLSADESVKMKDGWVRAMPPSMMTTAGFMTLVNTGDNAVKLIEFSSPSFTRVMLHETVHSNGTASMQHLHHLMIPAGGEVTLKPGGKHLMLMGRKAPLKEGDEVVVNLCEAKEQGCVTLKLEIKKG